MYSFMQLHLFLCVIKWIKCITGTSFSKQEKGCSKAAMVSWQECKEKQHVVSGGNIMLVLTLSEAEAHSSTSEVLITFDCKSGVCPSLAFCNKPTLNEKTAAPLKLYFKRYGI